MSVIVNYYNIFFIIYYFPKQNLEKMLLIISSLTVSPVISPKDEIAFSISIDTMSGKTPDSKSFIALFI